MVEITLGVKRPPALLIGGTDMLLDLPVALQHYEISMCEPLHDLKNVINRVMKELPSCVSTDLKLKEALSALLTELHGQL